MSHVYSKTLDRIDYQDSFSAEIKKDITMEQYIRAFFSKPNILGKILMAARNKIVALWGLKQASTDVDISLPLQQGDRVGLFYVFSVSEQEAISTFAQLMLLLLFWSHNQIYLYILPLVTYHFSAYTLILTTF